VVWEMAEREEFVSSIDKKKTLNIGPVSALGESGLRDQRLVIAFEEFIKREGIAWIR